MEKTQTWKEGLPGAWERGIFVIRNVICVNHILLSRDHKNHALFLEITLAYLASGLIMSVSGLRPIAHSHNWKGGPDVASLLIQCPRPEEIKLLFSEIRFDFYSDSNTSFLQMSAQPQ